MEGTQQSGVAFDLKIADLARDGQLLQYVREVAQKLWMRIRKESCLKRNLMEAIEGSAQNNVNWAAIS